MIQSLISEYQKPFLNLTEQVVNEIKDIAKNIELPDFKVFRNIRNFALCFINDLLENKMKKANKLLTNIIKAEKNCISWSHSSMTTINEDRQKKFKKYCEKFKKEDEKFLNFSPDDIELDFSSTGYRRNISRNIIFFFNFFNFSIFSYSNIRNNRLCY